MIGVIKVMTELEVLDDEEPIAEEELSTDREPSKRN